MQVKFLDIRAIPLGSLDPPLISVAYRVVPTRSWSKRKLPGRRSSLWSNVQ